MSTPSPNRRLILRLAAAVAAAGLLQAVYRWGGHRLVASEYARHNGPFLFNLIPASAPQPLAEYLDRADLVWRTFQAAWLAVVAILAAAPALDRMTGRVHDSCLRFGRACAARPAVFLTTGAVVVAALTALVGWSVLAHFPNSGDEYGYLYEAQTFLAGRLANTPHPLQPFFETTHIIERNGHLFGVFPPGWPLVIAGAMLVGVPAWLLNPLLSAGVFVLTFRLAERVTGDSATAALTSLTLAASSFFLMTGASYFSHTACAFFVVGAAIAMLRMTNGGAMTSMLAGLLAACAMITRYYTPILCLLPLALLLCRDRRWRINCLSAAVGALPPLVFLLVYNHALTGNPLVLSKGGVEQYDGIWFPPGTWHRGAEVLIAHLGELVLWTPPMLLAAYIAAVRKTPLATRLGAVGVGAACVMIGLYPYINRGGNQYGPRFYFDGFPMLVVAASAIVFGTTRYDDRPRGSRRLVYLFFASVLVHVPVAAIEMLTSRAQVVERLDLARQVERAGLNNAIVFLLTPIGVERPLPATDLTRNGIALDGPVLYALDRGPENVELERYYPGRACYTYAYDPHTRSGSLAPCARRQ